MATALYEAQENGNLKMVGQADHDDPALAVDEFRDENPRNQLREFVALITEDGESGQFVSVVVEDDTPQARPKRQIRVSGNGNGAGLLEPTVEPADEAPVRRTRRRATTKATPAKSASKAKARPKVKAKAKPAAKPAGKPAAKKGGSPFRSRAGGDD